MSPRYVRTDDHAKEREDDDRQEGGDGERQRLGEPPDEHPGSDPEHLALIGAKCRGSHPEAQQVCEGSRDGRDGPTLSARHVVDFS